LNIVDCNKDTRTIVTKITW